MITALALALTSVTFLLAAVAKFRAPAATEASLRAFGVPSVLAGTLKTALPGLEVAVAVALVLPMTFGLGAVAATLMLTVFSVAIAVQLAQGREPNCSCFGSASNAPISARTLLRNALLIVPSLTVLTGVTGRLDGLVARYPAASLSATLMLLTLGLAGVIILLWQQQATLMARVTSLENAAGQGLTPGRAALLSRVDLAMNTYSLAGTTQTLADHLAGARQALLVFIHPECAPCKELIEDVRRDEATTAGDLRVLYASSGPLEALRSLLSFTSADNVVRLEAHGVAKRFGVASTPAAVLLRPPGEVVGRANGRTAVLELLKAHRSTAEGAREPASRDGRRVMEAVHAP